MSDKPPAMEAAHGPRPKRALVVLLLLLAAAGAAYWAVVGRKPAPTGVVVANGTIEVTETEVGAEVSGRIVKLLVSEGDVLKPGALVAVLDDREIRARLVQAQGQANQAQSNLDRLLAGARPEQIAQARAQLAAAEAAMRGARQQIALSERAVRDAIELKQQWDAARSGVRTAEAARDAAQARLAEARAGARPQELDQAKARLAQAEAEVRGAELAVKTAEEARELVTELQQAYDAARTQRDAAAAQLDAAQAERTNARDTLARVKELFGEGAIARQQLDDAQARYDAAQARVTQAQASLSGANAAVANADKALRTRVGQRGQVEAAQTRLNTAKAARDQAIQALSLVREGTRSEALAQAEAAMRQAAAAVEGAQAAEVNARRAYEDRLQARSQAETARTQYETARSQADAARAQLDLLERGETREVIAMARGQVEQARGVLAQAQTALANTMVRSPAAGTVTQKIVEVGEVVSPGLPIIKMADLSAPWVKVYVPLPYQGQIRIGQPAKVVTDALKGRAFRGRVVAVSDTPEFTPKNVQTPEQRVAMVFWVKVAVENAGGALKPGMPADAELRP